MSQTVLFTLGTEPGTWLPVAQDLLRRAPAGVDLMLRGYSDWQARLATRAAEEGQPLSAFVDRSAGADTPEAALEDLAEISTQRKASWGGLDVSGAATLPLLLRAHPRARFLIYIESPVAALASELLGQNDCDAGDVLERWTTSARLILRHLHAYPGRSIVIDADEARQERSMATLVCVERTGIAFREPPDPSPWRPPVDALSLYLADVLAARHSASAAAYAELQAASLPLLGDADGGATGPRPDLRAAVVRLRLMEVARTAMERLGAERDATEGARAAAESARDAAMAETAEMLQRQHALEQQLANLLLGRQADAEQRAGLEDTRDKLQRQLDAALQATQQGEQAIETLKQGALVSQRLQATATETEQALRQQLLAAEVSRETAHRHRDELQRQLDKVRAEAGQLNALREQQAQALAQLEQRNQHTERELGESQKQLQQASSQADQLRLELAQINALREQQARVVAGLEGRAQDAEREGARQQKQIAALTAQTQGLRTDADRLATELTTAHQERGAAKEKATELNQHLQRTKLQAAQQRESAQRLAEERRLLLQQLHQSHAELSKLQGQLRDMDERLPFVGRARAHGMDLGQAVIGQARDDPPHRELSLQLPDVRLPGRAATGLSVRLVEHLGNSGLVILADGEPLLQGWRETGREGDRPLTLFVPADRDSRERLGLLSASDWHLLQALLSSIDRALRSAPAGQYARWPLVLRRLRGALAELPPQLRYDRLHSALMQGEDGREGLAITLDNVDLDGRCAARWGLRWWPAPGGGELEWQLGEAGCSELPLASWPLLDDGSVAPAHRLSLDGRGSARQRQGRWNRLTREDQQAWQGVLNLVPEALLQAQAGSAATPVPWSAWREAAAGLPQRMALDLRRTWGQRLRATLSCVRGR